VLSRAGGADGGQPRDVLLGSGTVALSKLLARPQVRVCCTGGVFGD